MNEDDLLHVDWSKLPQPSDDGAAAHLQGRALPSLSLAATDGTSVTLSALPGRTVVFAFPGPASPARFPWSMTGT